MPGYLQRSKYFLLLAVATGWVACRETASSPVIPPFAADATVHRVPWSAGSTAPAFPSGSATFWAYADRQTSLTVSALAADGTSQPFATITIPRGALLRRPDGSFFGLHDSVEITLTPDAASLAVELAPSGLVFNPLIPARLTLSYQNANPDFNGDGLVDQTDDYIQQVLLGLSTRTNPTDPWSVIPSVNDVVNQRVTADLAHFTGYAVSW